MATHPCPVMQKALDAIARETRLTVSSLHLAKVAYWRTLEGRRHLEELVPGLICPPESARDADDMEKVAARLVEHPNHSAADARDARALRLYAAEVRGNLILDRAAEDTLRQCA